MQSVSSRIWTRVAVCIPYDDNNYSTGTSVTVIVVGNESCDLCSSLFEFPHKANTLNTVNVGISMYVNN